MGAMTIEIWPVLLQGTRHLIRTVDGLEDDAFAEPSALPDWNRGHVIGHTALNAQALAGVLTGTTAGETVAMYPSAHARAADIEEMAALEPAELRDRFLASCTVFQDAVARMPTSKWPGSFSRVPGGPTVPVAAVLGLRQAEVEIHHADLLVGYGVADWPEEFLDGTFNTVVHDRDGGPAMTLRTPDGDVPISGGAGPVVTGSRADLTWWLIGRGDGTGLHADQPLPQLGRWR
jgi:maleylpyruvate isomerase